MAIYHCSIKIISRGKGKSAVAASAYRSGEKITNDYDGITHDYTRKSGIVHTQILLTERAPPEYADRSILWNAVEKIEKATNSQLAREIELALPAELTLEQNISLVNNYVKENLVSAGMCADICIHDKNGKNPHAHIMLTMRPFEIDGTWGAKSRKEYVFDDNGERVKLKNGTLKTYKVNLVDWNEQTKAEEWRAAWAEATNKILEQQGQESRVDHRSFERQGIEQIPTVHMGVAASQMERRGVTTERGNINREIKHKNNLLQQIWERAKQLKDWLKQALLPAAPLTLKEILQDILRTGENGNHNLQTVQTLLNFLKDNNISTMPELHEKRAEIVESSRSVYQSLQYYKQRTKTLTELIKEGEVYKKHLEVYEQYQKVKPRKKEKFFDSHRVEVMMFEAAQRYFERNHINSNFSLEKWKNEQTKIPDELSKCYRKDNLLSEKLLEVDSIIEAVESITENTNQPQINIVKIKGLER